MQPSFAGLYWAAIAREKGTEVIYISERAVFRLQAGGLVLTEIAPGMEVGKNIQSAVYFDFRVSPGLKEMDPRLFRPEPMGLKGSGTWQ